MTPAEKLAKITEVLNTGRTVFISTSLRAIKVTSKDLAKFAAINRPLFKADASSLYISAGKGYDCIDFCRITVR